MAIESKTVGTFINLSGLFVKTELNESGRLVISEDKERTAINNRKTYFEEGYFVSNPVFVPGEFRAHEKIVTTITATYGTVNVFTSVSSNALTWTPWKAVGAGGAITEDKKRYIRIKIVLIASKQEVASNVTTFSNAADIVGDSNVLTGTTGLTIGSTYTFKPDIVATDPVKSGKIFLKKINKADFKVITGISL